MLKRRIFTFALVPLALVSHTAATASDAPIKLLATLPDIAEIAAAIGGSAVQAESLLSGNEDPHFMDASPLFTLKAAKSDIVCAIGLGLESGWLPKVLSKSGNPKVQPGGVGFCELGRTVTVLEKPASAVDRSMGDVHAEGNPHFHLSPRALSEAADVIEKVLTAAKPSEAAGFAARRRQFDKRMTQLEEKVRELLKPGLKVAGNRPVAIEYHKEFAYFFALYGIKSMGSIEDKPGVAPSAARLAEVALAAKAAGVRLALAGPNVPKKHMARFTELSGIPNKVVSTGVQTAGDTAAKPSTIEAVQLSIAEAIRLAISP